MDSSSTAPDPSRINLAACRFCNVLVHGDQDGKLWRAGSLYFVTCHRCTKRMVFAAKLAAVGARNFGVPLIKKKYPTVLKTLRTFWKSYKQASKGLPEGLSSE